MRHLCRGRAALQLHFTATKTIDCLHQQRSQHDRGVHRSWARQAGDYSDQKQPSKSTKGRRVHHCNQRNQGITPIKKKTCWFIRSASAADTSRAHTNQREQNKWHLRPPPSAVLQKGPQARPVSGDAVAQPPSLHRLAQGHGLR